MFETLSPLNLTLSLSDCGAESQNDFGMEGIVGLETFDGLETTPSFEKNVGNINLDASSFGFESIIDGSMFEKEDDLVVPDDSSVGDDGLLSFEQMEEMNPVKKELEKRTVCARAGNGAGQFDFVLPRYWDDGFLEMKSAVLNRLLKQKKISADEQKEIKLARRRLLNRRYAKKSRTKKLQKWSNLEESHTDVRDTNSSLHQEVEQLKNANQLMKRRMTAMYDLLLKAGCMTQEQVENALQAVA